MAGDAGQNGEEDINIFEKDVVRRKKENVSFHTSREVAYSPGLQRQALETTAGYCPNVHESLSCQPAPVPSDGVCGGCLSPMCSAQLLAPFQAHWPLALKSLIKHLETEAHLLTCYQRLLLAEQTKPTTSLISSFTNC